MPSPQPDDQQRGTEQERHNLFERLVGVETLDGGLADEETETAGDRRSEQEPAEEGDAVRARVPAPQDEQRGRQRERAGRRGECEEQHVTAGIDHVQLRLSRRDRPTRRTHSGCAERFLNAWQTDRCERAQREMAGVLPASDDLVGDAMLRLDPHQVAALYAQLLRASGLPAASAGRPAQPLPGSLFEIHEDAARRTLTHRSKGARCGCSPGQRTT